MKDDLRLDESVSKSPNPVPLLLLTVHCYYTLAKVGDSLTVYGPIFRIASLMIRVD